MKKTLISLAIASVTLFGASSAMAQQNDKGKDKNKVENRGERKMDRPQAVNPFEGLNLTEAQQEALKALSEEKKQDMKKQNEEKANKQRQDRKDRAEAQKNARKEYLAKVKAILTPEQYCQFLENSYVNQGGKVTEMQRPSAKKAKGDKTARSAKNGKKGQRQAKKANTEKTA